MNCMLQVALPTSAARRNVSTYLALAKTRPTRQPNAKPNAHKETGPLPRQMPTPSARPHVSIHTSSRLPLHQRPPARVAVAPRPPLEEVLPALRAQDPVSSSDEQRHFVWNFFTDTCYLPGGSSASNTASSASASSTSGNGANDLRVGTIGLGFLGLVMAGLAL